MGPDNVLPILDHPVTVSFPPNLTLDFGCRRKEWLHTSNSTVIAITSEDASNSTGSNTNTGKISNLGKWEAKVVDISSG